MDTARAPQEAGAGAGWALPAAGTRPPSAPPLSPPDLASERRLCRSACRARSWGPALCAPASPALWTPACPSRPLSPPWLAGADTAPSWGSGGLGVACPDSHGTLRVRWLPRAQDPCPRSASDGGQCGQQ